MTEDRSLQAIDYATVKRSTGFARFVVTAIKFTVFFAVFTIACTVFWESCVADFLYHCTDSIGFDYLSGPGGFVHGTVAGQPGNFGDTIEPGWTIGRLNALWCALFGASVLLSALLCRITQRRPLAS